MPGWPAEAARRLWRHAFVLLALLLAVCANPMSTTEGPHKLTQVTVEWNASPEPIVAGYRLHYGEASRSYTAVVDVGKRTLYTLSGLIPGKIYYLAATACTASGHESAYSEELVFKAPSGS